MLQLQIRNILKSKGLAVTKGRKNVLKLLIQLAKPVSLLDIKMALKNIDRVTLFRILLVFEKTQIIHVINLDNGRKLYALCEQECSGQQHNHNHIHFQCQSCDDVVCLPIKAFPTLSLSNYIINDLNINASGICVSCNI